MGGGGNCSYDTKKLQKPSELVHVLRRLCNQLRKLYTKKTTGGLNV